MFRNLIAGEYAQADAEQARAAIAAATKAQPAWGLSTPQQRFDILDAAGAEILARRNELGDLLAREEGKTLPEAIGEVARAGNIFKFFDGEALRVGVNAAINSGFFSTGQRCTASSRLIVTAGIHDRFVDAMARRIGTLKVDDDRKAGTEIGPVVDEKQLAQDLEYIGIGKSEGARLVAGEELRRSAGAGQRHRVRPGRRHRHHLAQACDALQAPQPGRHGDGQPADGGRGLPRAVRRPQGIELRPARAGQVRGGVLHDGEDGVHASLRPGHTRRPGCRRHPGWLFHQEAA